MKPADPRTRSILEAYFDTPTDQHELLLDQLETCTLQGGEWLFRQGDPGDSFYLLIRGRLQVWLESDSSGLLPEAKLLGRVTPGDSVGEIGLLTGCARGAGVRAARDSQLIRVSRAMFENLSQHNTSLVLRLAGRAATLAQQPSTLASGATRNLSAIALLPLKDSERSREFCAQLLKELKSMGKTCVLDQTCLLSSDRQFVRGEGGIALPDDLVQRVHQLEDDSRMLVFQCEPGEHVWSEFALRQCDLVMLVGEHQEDTTVSEWELQLGVGDPESNLRRVLVLLQPEPEQEISGTSEWLRNRVVDFHLHVRQSLHTDIQRVARVVMGQAVGLVLGAGASRGFAHLGVYRAMCEAGISVDWLGGTSIGAIMAATIAFGRPPQQCIDAVRTSFVKGKPFSDYTLPVVSLLAGRRMKQLIRAQASMCIEDLPLPFFCISSSLHDGQPVVHQHGSLSRALEATASMPGIFPPSVVDKRLVIDGSVLNSLPVDVMWQQPVGVVVASDLAAQKTHTVDYEDIPSSWALLSSKWFGIGKRLRAPGLMTLMLKSTELATLQQVRAQGARASLLLQPDVSRFGLTQVKSFDQIVEAGYEHAKNRLADWVP